ncbi:hypothetical protein CJ305_09650 [Leeuwenhoekiella nanhaiensis]|uniref:Uncharacterized protein n=2 Tax=Leeuwenhoekiella nanhaiensis TaxID=1655491 RepID=A0A2G1VSH5_9FLAO|nr:hypothetical protein CJ305_09650 [Leeuwenhoekiella nanhaiensis]
MIFMIALFGILIYTLTLDSFLKAEMNYIETLIISAIVILAIALLNYGYIKNDEFHREKDILNNENKLIIEKYLVQLTEQREWSFIKNSEQLKVMTIPMWQIQIGNYSKLYMIYDNDDLLLNFSSYALFGLKFPVNYFCNRKIEQKIIQKIKTKIKNAP